MKKKKILLKILFFAVLLILCLSIPQFNHQSAPIIEEPQDNEQCLTCHGKMNCELDIFPGSLNQSAHKSLMCSACHIYVHKESPHLKLDMNNNCFGCHATDCPDNVHSASLEGGPGALCTDCHGVHNIQPIDDPKSSVYKLNVHKTCTKCHQDILQSYHYSFHGTAVSLGSLKAATCIDCHGSHEILPPTNPDSTVAKQNIPDTCAKCHKTPEPNFAKGIEHTTPYNKEQQGAYPLWIIWKFFIALILLDILKECTIAIFELIRKFKNMKLENRDNHNRWDI